MHDEQKVVEVARKGAAACEAAEIQTLKDFAAIDCGSQNEAGIKQAVAIVDGMLNKIKGIKITHKNFPGYGDVVVAKLTPEHPEGKIVLNAHTDTVFKVGDAAKYPYHEEGDKAYGLGIVDCKGGIVVAINAVRIMQEANMLPNKEIVFIFNCDEEIGAPVGHKVFDEEIPGTDMFFAFEPSRLENGVLTARKGAFNCDAYCGVRDYDCDFGNNWVYGIKFIRQKIKRKIKQQRKNN